ncbi:hypothetical protein C8Q80DRAFT_1185250 [Daedaleopsis nitida]|nr:hypothetical protein C8Q80DRAFT_1185250 [Daedaleopsis nitida]
MPPQKKPKLGIGKGKGKGDKAGNSKPEAAESSTDGATAVAQGQRATTRRNLRGKKGGLKDMPGMPLDILIEIFSLMHPRDLLSLARTSKDFRALLMSRNSMSLWKAARQQVPGLPDCPSYLSEPAHANLAFFTHCHRCLKPNVKTVIWEFSVRYCPECKKEMLCDTFSYTYFFLRMSRELGEPSGRRMLTIHLMPATKGARYGDPYYHVPEVETFKTKYASLRTVEEKKIFIMEAEDMVTMREEHAKAMGQWKLNQEESRSAELDVIKKARFDAIKDRLRDEGWEDELNDMPSYEHRSLARLKACRKSQKLTEHAWQSIRQEILEFMERVRTNRLDSEHQELLRQRLTILYGLITKWEQSSIPRSADTDWHPLFADFALMPCFREIVEAPSETEVTAEDFQHLRDQLPALRNAWVEERRAEFESITAVAPTGDDVPPLSLAVVTFGCKRCHRNGLRWPHVLAHACPRAPLFRHRAEGPDQKLRQAIDNTCINQEQLTLLSPTGQRAFTPVPKFNVPTKKVELAIEACGKDPAVATYEEMEACGVRLICTTCLQPKHTCEVFDWKSAAHHTGTNVLEELVLPEWGHITKDLTHDPTFQPLDAELTAQVKMLEAAAVAAAPNTLFGCTRCRRRGRTANMKDHCTRKHGIEQPELGADYYVHAASERPQIRIYPQSHQDHPVVVADVQAHRALVSSSLFPSS